jgi:hypothetical protein
VRWGRCADPSPARLRTLTHEMAKLIDVAITSLDGCVAHEQGFLEWAQLDEGGHAFINDTRCSVGTGVYGRRIYETMAGWQTDATLAAQSEVRRDLAHIWEAADKIVYVSGLRTLGRLHARGPKPRRVNSIFFQCSGRRTGNNSGSGSSLASSLRIEVQP